MLTKDFELKKKEHQAVREDVGYYDFTHSIAEVTGKDAEKFLDKVYVNYISNTPVGKAVYSTMLNEDGHVIDDIIVFKIGREHYLISTLYVNELIEWFDKHKEDEEVEYKDVSTESGMFAVQGPKSRDLLNKLLDEDITDLEFLCMTDNTVGDLKVLVARAGYTGELGYELYIATDKKEQLEAKLQEVGKEFNLMNITTDIIVTSLPTEKGYVLVSDMEGANPFEVGYGWSVKMDKDFIGKEAVQKSLDAGIHRELAGFEIEDQDVEINPGDKVYFDGKEIGHVTRYTYSFTMEKFLGYALIDTTDAKEGDTVEIGPNKVQTKLVNRVFYDPENLRVKA